MSNAISAVLVLSLLLAGCANGVRMTDDEAKECRTVGCAAFTEIELLGVMGRAYKDGYLRGWTDSNTQGGRSL